MKNTLIISEEYEGMRIDSYIASQIDDISRTAIQKLLLDNNIIVNDKPCKSNYKLRANDVIKIDIPELKDPKILPENIELSILYEDNDWFDIVHRIHTSIIKDIKYANNQVIVETQNTKLIFKLFN